jgi:excisionase family DNA binding protein
VASERQVDALFEHLEQLAPTLTADAALGAIARTARVDAVLRARHAALAAPPAASASLPRYLGAKDAAAFLVVSRSTLLRLVKGGKVRESRPSKGVVRFDREELERFMAGDDPKKAS